MASEQIELGDFLLFAEAHLGIDAHRLHSVARLSNAESALAAPFASFGGRAFYPDAAERAAIVCSRIIRNHPLPDGNKRVGYTCLLEQLHRAGLTWEPPSEDERVETIEGLAAATITEEEFVAWVQRHAS